MEESAGKNLTCVLIKIQLAKYVMEHLQKPDMFWNMFVLWTDDVEIKFFGNNQQRYVRGEKEEHFLKQRTLPIVKYWGGSTMFSDCVAVGQETLHRCKQNGIPVNINKFWKHD